MRLLRTFASGLVAALLTSVPAQSHELIGANLNTIADFSRNQEFVDLVRQSREFGSFADPFNTIIAVGPDGWPTGDFGVTLLGGGQANVQGIGGTYKVIFNGRATVTSAAAGTVANATYDAASNTSRLDVVFPADGDTLALRFAITPGAAANAVKNLRVIRPGFDATNPPTYTTAWLAHVSRFRVLRFMDWLSTNDKANAIVTWADRPTLEKKRTEANGARWEAIVELANAANRDIWINVPVRANDEYVRNLATLLRDTLNPNVNVYVEYSNELWNGAFPQFAIQRDLAVAEASIPGSPLRFDGSADTSTWAFRRVGKRLKEMSDIFASVWGAAAINTRVRPVLAGQMANSFIVSQGLEVVDEGMATRPSTVFYAIAGAPYLFPSATNDAQADEAPGFSVEQIIAGLQAAVANAPNGNSYQYESHAGLGAWYGMKVLAYEGGFDTFGGQNIAAKRAANLDPRVRSICRSLLDGWHAAGFEQFLWFNAGADNYAIPFGQWPLLEDIRDTAKPKNQCIDDVAAATLPAITMGNAVTAPISGGAFRGSTATTAPLTNASGPFGFPGFVEYLLRVDTAGTYSLTFTAQGSSSPKVGIRVNNAVVNASFGLPESATLTTSQPVSITLRKGLNALRLYRPASAGSWSIQSLSVASGGAGPANFTALWFNASEPGWGININHQGNIQFATLFTYAADGRDLWLVASNLALQADGSFTGDLFRATGAPFNTVPFPPANVSKVGTMTLRYATADTGTLVYSFNGTSVTKAIQKQVFSTAPNCTGATGSRAGATVFQDLWFNAAEPGWGINFTHQGNILFATLFDYAADGRDLWLVASNMARQPDGRFTGDLFRATGAPFNTVPFPAAVVTKVGTMAVAFSNGETGTLTYDFNGITVTKPIQRQVFASPVPSCVFPG